MDITSKFWSVYCNVIYSAYYFWHYRERSIFFDAIVKIFLAAASLASAAGWVLHGGVHFVLATILFASQVVSATSYLFPFQKRIDAIGFMLPQLSALQCEMSQMWDRIENMSEEEITVALHCFEQSHTQVMGLYTGDGSYRRSEKCKNKAIADRTDYLFEIYGYLEIEYLGKENEK